MNEAPIDFNEAEAQRIMREAIGGRCVVPTLHPAFLLRGADTWRPVLAGDIRRALRRLRQGPKMRLWDVGPYTVCKTAGHLKAELAKLGRTVELDVETDGRDPVVCGMLLLGIAEIPRHVGLEPRIVIAYPWKASMAPVVTKFLKRRTVVTHNGPAFDEIVCERHGVTYPNKEDTLIAHHSFASHLRQGLDHVASVYVDCGPWKLHYRGKEIDEKGGFGISAEDLPAYNAADVRLGSLAWLGMQKDLEPEMKVYRSSMAMADLCRRMQVAGILVDQQRRVELSRKMKFRQAALLGAMRTRTKNSGFSPTRLTDIRTALYETFGVKAWKPTPTGQPSTDRYVLEALRVTDTEAGQLADQILRWRSAADKRAEYLDNVPIGPDGRVHAGWKSYGTETGRPATRNPNMLNTPRCEACKDCGTLLIDGKPHKESCRRPSVAEPEAQIRDVYIAAPGTRFVYFDLSQAEMRFAAHLSGDERFIDACSRDVHAGNAAVLFPDAAEILRTDPKGKGKRFRDIAKNAGFAVTYLAEAETVFAYLRGKGFAVTLPDVESMLWRMKAAYRKYYDFVDGNVRFAQAHGYLRSCFTGRIRWVGWHPKPTTVANFPIQSGVADVMNERLVRLDKRLPKEARLLIYAYDAATYEVPERFVERVEKEIDAMWEEPVVVPANGLSFRQPIDKKQGTRWSDFG